jgi:hypothetical protein
VKERADDEGVVLDEIVRRIVRIAAPERIVLFGSAARRLAARRGRTAVSICS